MTARRPPVLLLLPALALLTAACIGGSTPQSRFYVLQPTLSEGGPSAGGPSAGGAATASGGLVLLVGPVTLPASLDRPQIVTLRGTHERGVSELHRWAEPLQDGVERVLAENLEALTGSDQVYRVPTRNHVDGSHRVIVDVHEFGPAPGGACVLTARWRVFDRGMRLLASRRATYSAPAGATHADHVAAMSRVLADLSEDVAAALAP